MGKMAKNSARTVIKVSRHTTEPNAKQFLTHYFALQRPNTQHLFFTKGSVDFLLGLIVGILVGLIIAAMANPA